MRIVVLTSCTGEKAVHHPGALLLDDFRRGPGHVARRERELGDLLRPAGALYTGRQHQLLLQGVRALREAGDEVELHVLSAGYGVVPEDRLLAPYDATFTGMRRAELRDWARQLGVPGDARRVLSRPSDLALVLLGDPYLRAVQPGPDLVPGGPTLFLCGAGAARTLPDHPRVRPVVHALADTRRFSCGLVGLKGEIARRALVLLARDPAALRELTDPSADVLGRLAAVR